MEVWDLEECDFYETCFKEYNNEDEFYNDMGDKFSRNKEGKRIGVIIQFYDGSNPIYKYPPIDITKKEYDIWYDNCLEKNKHLNWIKNIYWYLNDFHV